MKYCTYLALIVSLILTACGGGGGEGDSSPPSRATGSISGTVFDAPVSSALVKIWEYKNGKVGRLLGESTTDPYGKYNIPFSSASMPVLIQVGNGQYFDPISLEFVKLSSAGSSKSLSSLLNYVEGQNLKVMVTPLTHMAAGLAEYKISQNISASSAITSALDTVSTMYGFNVNSTEPITLNISNDQNSFQQPDDFSYVTDGHKYGLLLTAYSSYAKEIRDTIDTTGPNTQYTTINLSSIQYDDIRADGKLNGASIPGLPPNLDFGNTKVNSDLYTKDLAKHIIIVANLAENLTTDKVREFADKINLLGTEECKGNELAICGRKKNDIDSTPPKAERNGEGILAGISTISLKMTDNVGVDEPANIVLQYAQTDDPQHSDWINIGLCTDEPQPNACSLELESFRQGALETKVDVRVNTEYLDDQGAIKARLLVYTTDVLGNTSKDSQSENLPYAISFDWDNQKPVINVTSGRSVKAGEDNYVLMGNVIESTQSVESVKVKFKGEVVELECKKVESRDKNKCVFEKRDPTNDLGNVAKFILSATDAQGNTGTKVHLVGQDSIPPTVEIAYPRNSPQSNGDIEFNYVLEGEAGERSDPNLPFNDESFPSDSFESAKKYLKIDYKYANQVIKGAEDVPVFDDFKQSYFIGRKIPYVIATISDTEQPIEGDDDSEPFNLGTPANDLTLEVEYCVKKEGKGEYDCKKTVTTKAEDLKVPYQKVDSDGNWLGKMHYYIPLTKDILGERFKNVTKLDSQKLVIRTIDNAGITSAEQTIYFKTTFDIPTFTVVTPFIGAEASLMGLENGKFENLGTVCTTSRLGNARDVASCTLQSYKASSYRALSIKLTSLAGAYYYNWQDTDAAKKTVNLDTFTDANFGVYFQPNGSKSYYITELSTYHTGMFDYLWEKSERNDQAFINILDHVSEALAGDKSFFGFDPTTTPYATNKMLDTLFGGIFSDNIIPPEYQHRFIAEAMAGLTELLPSSNSTTLAAAIYMDLSTDGKADGKGKKGNPAKLDNVYAISEKTYRLDIASKYQEVLSGRVDAPTTLVYADKIAKASPKLDGQKVFLNEGSSIDIDPPKVELDITQGSYYFNNENKKQYVAGKVKGQLSVSDAAGISLDSLTLEPFWYTRLEPNRGEEAKDVRFEADEKYNNNIYQQWFNFSLDTLRPDHQDKIEFAILTRVADNNGNGEHLDKYQRLFIDNEPPSVSLVRPKNLESNEPLDEDTYLNANFAHTLLFTLTDDVNDQQDKRVLVFKHKDNQGEERRYNYDRFSLTAQDRFSVKVCKESECKNDNKVIYPGDGEWEVYVNAVDNLGNSVTETSSNQQKFSVLIDSTPPEVTNTEPDNMLGGNTLFKPDVKWGEGSDGQNLEVELKIGNESSIKLSECDENEARCTDIPHLVGDQPNVQVRLSANAFTHGELNTLSYIATDKAYPANRSERGTVKFRVDKQGPKVSFQTPWLVDSVSKQSKVLGTSLTAKFEKVEDDSGVEKVELFQRIGTEEVPITDWRVNDWNNKFSVDYIEIEIDRPKIKVSEDKRAQLFIKATDKHGFVSSTNVESFIIDREGPQLDLNGHNNNGNEFYLSNYQFTITAKDYDSRGDINLNGVNTETFKYWLYKKGSQPLGQGTEPLKDNDGGGYKIPLQSSLLDTTGKDNIVLKLEALDIRGNKATKEFELKIRNQRPQMENFDIVYAESGSVIGSKGLVTKSEDLKLILEVSDISGIDAVLASYSDEDNNPTSIVFSLVEGKWQATLPANNLKKDGDYELTIKVFNNVKYLKEENRLPLEFSRILHVQRQGVELSITKPTPFSSHVSGKTLSAEFAVENHVQPKQIQCWIRENYTSTEAPQGQDRGENTSGEIKLNLNEAPRCSITSNEDFNQNPVLIVETLGQNDATNVQLFSFKQLDSQPPVRDFAEQYAVTKANINPASGDRPKQFFMELAFKDNMSGVNINDGTWPILEQGLETFEPIGCKSRQNRQFSCTYKWKYSRFIGSIQPNLNYQITNLVDNAGNRAEPYNLKLVLPNKAPEVSINIADNSSELTQYTIVKGGEEYTVILKTSLNENSSIDEIEVKVGDRVYSSSNPQDRDAFQNVKCDNATCTGFTFKVPDKIVRFNLTVTVKDVFGLKGEGSVDNLRVDKDDPTIGSIQSIERRGENIRFTFDISDQTSGLNEVTYKVKGIETPIIKQEQGKGEALYFELKASDLGLEPLTVDIIAKDRVGRNTITKRVINLTLPQISLTLSPETNFVGERLAVKDEKLSVTLNSENEGSLITAKSYSVMVAGSELEGEFSDTSWPLEIGINSDRQGQSSLIIKVTDSLGRQITEFTYSDKEYDADGIPVLVDFVDPEIKSLSASKSSMVKEEGKYPVKVTAEVSDLHLSQVTVVLLNDEGTPVSQVSLKPSDDNGYTTTLNVAAGDYQVKVVALDRAGRKSEKKTDMTVEESPTPSVSMSLLDAPSDNKIGGDKNVTLVLTFSEAVNGFESGDVLMRIGDEEYGPASLKDFKAIDKDGKQWQASYTTPSDIDTEVTFKIEDDSYLSKNNILGKGTELILDIKGTKPQVSSVELPDSATVGETINVSVTFTEEVTKPLGSTLGDAAVTWSEGDDFRRTWIGQVMVPSTDVSTLTLNLSIKGYQDKYANLGVENTNNSVFLNHVLSINEIDNVGQNSPKTIDIGGTWAHLQGQLTLTVSSKNYENVPLSENGTWSQEVSIEGLPQGSITVMVSGNNAKDEVVTGEKQTFIFDDAAPVIDDESLSVSRDDENGAVTLGFDIQDAASGLTQVTYKFNGKEINKDGTDNNQLQLMANDLAGKDELKIHITAVDELGQSTEVAKTINIAQPKVSLSLQGAADLMEGLLPLTQLPQSMTLTAPSAEGSVVQAAGYSMTLVPSGEGKESTVKQGTFTHGSADIEIKEDELEQGEFALRLVVTDSLGREITEFTYSDKEYDADGIPVLVDFVDPDIKSLSASKSSMVKEEGKYPVEVKAEVSDLHLSQVTVVLLNDEGTPVSQVSLKPSDDNGYTTTLNVAAGDYQVKVVALDRAGRKSEQKTDVTVEESPTPTVSMSLLDATSGNKIGGGQNVTLEMTFSEAVNGFESGDILMRIGEETYKSTSSTLTEREKGKSWQASYRMPSDTDTKVTFKIEDDSYLSENNIPGKGTELTLDIKGSKPSVESVTLSDSATVGETINVSVTFTEEVTKPSGSTLGDAAVTWSEGDDFRRTWIGQVTVPSTDVSTLTLNLSIKGYQDKYANLGVENTNNSVFLNHVLSINSIDNVGQNSGKTIVIEGQWAHLDAPVTLTLSSQNSSITEKVISFSPDGTWHQEVSIDSLTQGLITVTVSGNNAEGQKVEGEKQTFTFDAAAPVINEEFLEISYDNNHATFGFDIQDEVSGLSKVTYQFNDKEIVKGQDDVDKTQLQLTAEDLAGKDELKVAIKAEDTLGQTISVERTINVAQPKVSLSLQGPADLIEGTLSLTQLPQSMTLSAPSASGSVVNAAGYRVTLVPSDESGNTVTLSELELPSGSTDSTAEFNLAASQIPQGEFTLRLVVTDSLGREIEQFTYSDETYGARGVPVLVDFVDPEVSNVDWKTSQASAGEQVAFTVTFSEPVSQPLGSTLGDAPVTWSGSDELSQEWIGQVTLPSELATSLESLTLLVKGHADRTGNLGGENREYSLPLTPPVEIPDNSGTEDSLEMPREDSELSELDPGSSESEIEETRLAA